MKNLVLMITVILFLIIFVFGHLHWKNEIEQNAKKAEAQVEMQNDNDAAEDNHNDVKSKTNMKKETATITNSNIDFDVLTRNLSDAVKNKVLQAQEQHKQVNVVLGGGQEISGLAPLLQAKLDEAYGKDFFKVAEESFQDQNSLSVYQDQLYSKLVEGNPDIVIFTPLLVHDLGKVSSSDSARVPVLIGTRIQEASPETVFLIEPPNPVTFNDSINERVNAVKTEAESSEFEYIDHLSSWPTGTDLEADLDSQGEYPNAQGLKIWADALAGYFTSSNE